VAGERPERAPLAFPRGNSQGITEREAIAENSAERHLEILAVFS